MKSQIRKEILELRKNITADRAEIDSRIIFQKVIQKSEYLSADFVFAYIDAKGEAKTEELIRHAWEMGKTVAVPKVHGNDMEFYIIHSFQDLELGNFGIREPKEECQIVKKVPEKAVVVLPGVAFDRNGNRIGYGKGYYDKYFSDMKKIYKIGLAYEFQIVEDAYAQLHDIKADCILTEG